MQHTKINHFFSKISSRYQMNHLFSGMSSTFTKFNLLVLYDETTGISTTTKTTDEYDNKFGGLTKGNPWMDEKS
jgi:hypothetical protein